MTADTVNVSENELFVAWGAEAKVALPPVPVVAVYTAVGKPEVAYLVL